MTPEHKPFIPAETVVPEFTWPAVLSGVILGIIFGASSLYLCLKVGMVVTVSIPIAVLSITLFRQLSRLAGIRPATILENNIVQTTGSAAESVATGVGFTLPALLILGYDLEWARVMVVGTLGGILGVLLMIPLRRAFIVKQHGTLTYPEGTACADVLIAGERGGMTAKAVFSGFGIGFVYKFLMSALHLWQEIPERALSFFTGAAVSAEVSPELLGVGYIIGTRIACVMGAGGILSSLVLIPAIKLFGQTSAAPIFPAVKLIQDMSAEEVWKSYVLYIGAGSVAAGGIVSLLQAVPLIFSSIRAGLADIGGGTIRLTKQVKNRLEDDLPNSVIVLGTLIFIVGFALTPQFGLGSGLRGFVGALLILFFGFFFVTVSSRICGEIGTSSNPVSGMTVATLLLTCLIFVLLSHLDPGGEWVGKGARLTALSVAAVICVAASNGGHTSQDLKTGYLVGATPKYQQIGLLVGVLTSALVIGWTLLLLNRASTVYARRDYPAITAPVADLAQKARLEGPGSESDASLYHVWRVGEGEVAGLPQGKYLVDDLGKIRYLVDPGINGVESRRADGSVVMKYNAPKARLISLIIDGILTRRLPWGLVLLGVCISIVLELCGIESLPFAVGVYLPLSASTPILLGGVARWIADRWSRRSAAESEMSPGILLSTGYIAGGTIAGITIAFMSLNPYLMKRIDFSGLGAWTQNSLTSVIACGLLLVFLILVGAEKLLAAKARRADRLKSA